MTTKALRLEKARADTRRARRLWEYYEHLIDAYDEEDVSVRRQLLDERAWEAALECIRLCNLVHDILDEPEEPEEPESLCGQGPTCKEVGTGRWFKTA